MNSEAIGWFTPLKLAAIGALFEGMQAHATNTIAEVVQGLVVFEKVLHDMVMSMQENHLGQRSANKICSILLPCCFQNNWFFRFQLPHDSGILTQPVSTVSTCQINLTPVNGRTLFQTPDPVCKIFIKISINCPAISQISSLWNSCLQKKKTAEKWHTLSKQFCYNGWQFRPSEELVSPSPTSPSASSLPPLLAATRLRRRGRLSYGGDDGQPPPAGWQVCWDDDEEH